MSPCEPTLGDPSIKRCTGRPVLVDSSLIGATLEVLLINIVLSGDNAVVIGMAAHGLPGRQRRQAIMLGGVLAVLLRLALTIPAERALQVPFLGAAGGLLLAWVAYRLLTSDEERDHRGGARCGRPSA